MAGSTCRRTADDGANVRGKERVKYLRRGAPSCPQSHAINELAVERADGAKVGEIRRLRDGGVAARIIGFSQISCRLRDCFSNIAFIPLQFLVGNVCLLKILTFKQRNLTLWTSGRFSLNLSPVAPPRLSRGRRLVRRVYLTRRPFHAANGRSRLADSGAPVTPETSGRDARYQGKASGQMALVGEATANGDFGDWHILEQQFLGAGDAVFGEPA